MWLRMEGVRPASRSEDRMAVMAMKRASDARKSLVRREVASVCYIMCGAATGGEADASLVDNVRRGRVQCK